MSQTFSAILGTETLQVSRTNLNNNMDALKTNFSGSAFPTSGLVLGMDCYRTDQGRRYTLTQVSPAVWTLIWDAGNFDPGNYSPRGGPGSGAAFSVGDITASRNDGTGVIFLGNAGNRYLYWNGSTYNMPGGDLTLNGRNVNATLDSALSAIAGKQANLGFSPVRAQYTGNGIQIGWDGSLPIWIDTTHIGYVALRSWVTSLGYVTGDWVDARYVDAIRLGTQIAVGNSANTYQAPSGHVYTALQAFSGGVTGFFCRPVQENIGNAWATVG